MKTNPIHLLVAGMIILSSCEKNFVELPEVVPPPLLPKEISFSADIYPVFSSGCLGSLCHSAGEMAPDLSTNGRAYDALITGSSATSATAGKYIDLQMHHLACYI